MIISNSYVVLVTQKMKKGMNVSTIHSRWKKDMKKIFTFILMIASLVIFGSFVSQKGSAASVEANEAVGDLFEKYYNDGQYTKDTKIFINKSEELKQEIMTYFHDEVTELERTTYYSKDALWMSREDGKYSYYGTSYDGSAAVGVTNATATKAYETPADAPVVLSGAGKTSMEEYFCTLNDFALGTHKSSHTNDAAITLNAEWVEVDGVYYNTSAGVLDGFRLFTAPLWLNTPESQNYISYSLATVEVVDGDLVMTLWTSEGDVSKLSNSTTKTYNGQTYHSFSKATIHENNIDGEKGTFYDNLTPYKGSRTNPKVTHETYIYLGEKGVYVYQIVEDGSGLNSTKSHVELYFTTGVDKVADKSLSVHIYPTSTDPLRSYTFSSTTNISRNDNLAKTYCTYSTKILTNESAYGKYAVELFLDYSYFGLTKAPESINVQIRAQSGGGNPMTNNVAGGLEYKDINNYYTVKNPEAAVDGEKDAIYNHGSNFTGSRTNPTVKHDTSIYLGEKGLYVYQVIEDGKGIVSGTSHAELYFTLGEEQVADKSLSLHIYPKHSEALRSYTYTSTTNTSRNDALGKTYCTYSVNVITDQTNNGKYAIELYLDYSYFGLTKAPKSIKLQVRAISGGGNPMTNNVAGGLEYKDINNYYTVKNLEIVVDGNKDAKYDALTPVTGSRQGVSHEAYVYLGEDGVYIYQLAKDTSGLLNNNTRSEIYICTGSSLATGTTTQGNAYGIYYYMNYADSHADSFRAYFYNGTEFSRNDNALEKYAKYSHKVVETGSGYELYAYEVFISYEYFGLTEAPETIGVYIVSRINTGGGLGNTGSTSIANTNIANYLTYDKNGLVK